VIENRFLRRAAASVLSCVSLIQSAEFIAPTAFIARALTPTIIGGIAGEIALAGNAWAGGAQDGQNFGGTMLGQGASAILGQGSAATAQNTVNGIGGYSSTQMSAAQGSWSIANPSLKATGVGTFSCAQSAAMGIQGSACPPLTAGASSSCQDPNQPTALNALQTTAANALASALSVCQPVGQAIQSGVIAYIPTIPAGSTPTTQLAYQNQLTMARNLSTQAQDLSTQVKTLQSSLQDVVSQYQATPGCNVLASTDVNAMASSITNAANALSTSCSSVSTAVNASTVSPLLGQLTGINSNFMAGANGQPAQVVLAQLKSMKAYMATTNGGAITIGQLMGPYAQGASNTLSTNTGNPIVNQLNDPANAGLVATMTNILQSTDPQNLVPLGDGLFGSCTGTQTKIQTTLGPNGQVNYTSVTDPVTPKSPAGTVCVDSGKAAPSTGSGKWIYLPATSGQCNGTPAASAQLSYSFQVPYTGGAGQLNIYTQAEATTSGSIVIQPRGGTAVNITLSPGQLVQGVPNSPSPPNVTVPVSSASQAGMMTVDATLSGPGELWMSLDNSGSNFLGTSAQWYSTQAAQQQTLQNTGYTPATGSGAGSNAASVNVQPPSAVQNSVSCKAAVQCLGTQCHSILGTQDESFTQAAGGMAALSSIAQNACCAPGTSMAAGNCNLMVFCGKANTCRNFLLSGAGITNNCCDQPVNASPWATMLKIFTIAYAQGWIPSYTGALATNVPSWMSSSYDNMSAWYNETTGAITSAAGQVWSTVTGPFKSIAQSWSNAWGAGGPTSFSQVISSLANFTGTGTTPPSGTNAGGANYAPGSANGQTSAVQMTGGSGGMQAGIQGLGTAANILAGGMQPIADAVIEQIAPQYAAAIESAAFGAATPAAIQASGGQQVVGGVVTDVNNPSAYTGSSSSTSALGSGILGDIMLAYAIYQIAVLVGHLITRCTSEEFTFYSNRHQRLCFNVGNYCSNSDFFGICLETTYTACCYPSMIERIIMQQLLILDPGVVPNSTSTQPYGTPQNPACSGLTPQALQAVSAGGYMNKVNLSEYIAYLVQNNLLPTTNEQGAQFITPQTNNTTGLVDSTGKPTTNAAIYTGQ
jgi:hypothetical protein